VPAEILSFFSHGLLTAESSTSNAHSLLSFFFFFFEKLLQAGGNSFQRLKAF
jgi:hypothetical protein